MSSMLKIFEGRGQLIKGLVIGLIAGPILTGILGWQLLASTARDMVQSAVFAQQVKVCHYRALAANPDAAKLSWSARYDLAKIWAKMPWQDTASAEVVKGCTDGLEKAA